MVRLLGLYRDCLRAVSRFWQFFLVKLHKGYQDETDKFSQNFNIFIKNTDGTLKKVVE